MSKVMVKMIIDGFKPRGSDSYASEEVYLSIGDIRIEHLRELIELFRDNGYDEEADALEEFLEQDELNDRLLSILCEKTDAHPVHFLV